MKIYLAKKRFCDLKKKNKVNFVFVGVFKTPKHDFN